MTAPSSAPGREFHEQPPALVGHPSRFHPAALRPPLSFGALPISAAQALPVLRPRAGARCPPLDSHPPGAQSRRPLRLSALHSRPSLASSSSVRPLQLTPPQPAPPAASAAGPATFADCTAQVATASDNAERPSGVQAAAAESPAYRADAPCVPPAASRGAAADPPFDP